jgi:hypothetical protein
LGRVENETNEMRSIRNEVVGRECGKAGYLKNGGMKRFEVLATQRTHPSMVPDQLFQFPQRGKEKRHQGEKETSHEHLSEKIGLYLPRPTLSHHFC